MSYFVPCLTTLADVFVALAQPTESQLATSSFLTGPPRLVWFCGGVVVLMGCSVGLCGGADEEECRWLLAATYLRARTVAMMQLFSRFTSSL